MEKELFIIVKGNGENHYMLHGFTDHPVFLASGGKEEVIERMKSICNKVRYNGHKLLSYFSRVAEKTEYRLVEGKGGKDSKVSGRYPNFEEYIMQEWDNTYSDLFESTMQELEKSITWERPRIKVVKPKVSRSTATLVEEGKLEKTSKVRVIRPKVKVRR